MKYTGEELSQLHAALYELLGEVDRVCEECGIEYFIIGGTAIGAHFWQGMIPWDDDIDIGMTRDNYERFLRLAPHHLKAQYQLQWHGSEPHTPFWFAKVRKNGTLFAESVFADIDMHQGIYVDIFPFDRIPRQAWKERLQWHALQFFNGLFIAKEIWQWRWCGHCQIEEPRPRGFLPCLATRVLITVMPKSLIYRCINAVGKWFNGNKHLLYCKNIITTNERVLIDEVEHPQRLAFGPLQVKAPRDLMAYLHAHYPVLEKHLPEEQQVNHRPRELKF